VNIRERELVTPGVGYSAIISSYSGFSVKKESHRQVNLCSNIAQDTKETTNQEKMSTFHAMCGQENSIINKRNNYSI